MSEVIIICDANLLHAFDGVEKDTCHLLNQASEVQVLVFCDLRTMDHVLQVPSALYVPQTELTRPGMAQLAKRANELYFFLTRPCCTVVHARCSWTEPCLGVYKANDTICSYRDRFTCLKPGYGSLALAGASFQHSGGWLQAPPVYYYW